MRVTAERDAAGGYDGLFGPGSVTWRVHGDPILWIGGLRALFLQATHPVAMSGVLRHSDFRDDPWGRLMRTAEYVGTVSYGSRSEAETVAGRVRRLHGKVAGTDPLTGAFYRASDPELLRWVHCCEVESFLTTYVRAGGRLSAADIDRYYDEQRRSAALVGIAPADVPGTAAEMAAYFDRMRAQLAVDNRTRRIAGLILVPPMPTRVALLTPARPAWAAGASVAFGLLPRWARRMYGLPGLPTTDLAAVAAVRGLRGLMQAAPTRLREGPHLREARARLAATEAASG